MLSSVLWIIFSIWLEELPEVWSHGRLISPPSRSSMWRLGFPTKKNYDDDSLYCGGIMIQWQKNGGKCGICGDPYDMTHPRDNEAGGKYGRGIISKQYFSGQILEATVYLTANHKGYFEFRLCPNNNPKKEATQECLDKYTLKLVDRSDTKFYIPDARNGNISVKLQLPEELACSQCVFQWTYVAGNNWGLCEDGGSRLGCGPQETFRGCADIEIVQNISSSSYKSNENESKSQWNSHHKNKKQKLLKNISISKHPNVLETSEIQKNGKTVKKFSDLNNDLTTSDSELIIGSTLISTSTNHDNQKQVYTWDALDLYKHSEGKKGIEAPMIKEIFLDPSAAKQDIFSILDKSKMIDDTNPKISGLYKHIQEEIELLRFYLQESISRENEEVQELDFST